MGRQVNWSSVQIGSPAKTWSEVRDVQIAAQGRELMGSADADIFNTSLLLVQASPQITVMSEDDGNMATIPLGTSGTFTAVHNDSSGGVADVTVTLSNAIVIDYSASGPHQQHSSVTHVLKSYSSDGTTSPLSVAVGS